MGGLVPVTDSTVTLYAAGSGSAAATVLGSANSSGSGSWKIGYTCPAASTPVYITAVGGNPGLSVDTNNSALHLMAALGACGQIPPSATIDELTTVAAAYALGGFMDQSNPDNVHGAQAGLSDAMHGAALIASVVSGLDGALLNSTISTCTGSAPPLNCLGEMRLNALANALDACVQSSAPGSQTCTELFDCATPGASFAGSGATDCTPGSSTGIATDTLRAIQSIARNPGLVSMAGIFDVDSRAPVFAPAIGATPNDWSLSVTFTNVGLSEPTTTAVDAAGNVWIANYDQRVVELAPDGSPLSPANGFTGGGLKESFGLAIDASGHVWVANEQSNGVNNGLGSVTELDSNGNVLSPAGGFSGGGLDFPQAVVVDAEGNLWFPNAGNASLTELSSAGAAMSPASGYTGGGLSFPVGLALDTAGDVWVANQAENEVSAFGPTGAPLSPAGGYTGGGLKLPQGVAVDAHGNVWVTNLYGDSVSEFNSGGAPVSGSGYQGGGLTGPAGIAIDSAGRVWVANYYGNSLTELAGADDPTPGAPLSPPVTGYQAAGVSLPYGIAIDASGNLWLTNFGSDSVTVFIGIAAPVKTPLIGVPTAP